MITIINMKTIMITFKNFAFIYTLHLYKTMQIYN